MFVRWKKRVTKKGPVFYAVLVECRRVGGKPRQRVIKHLAHIKEKYLGETAHQQYFWQRVDFWLDSLEVPAETRKSIEEKLTPIVHRPTQEELVKLENERKLL
ncbi:MAG: hypothetical protein K6U74_05950 [Firmicutes bacterium]|nr:hypothetical protein [Bacillota bacterium]